MDLVPEEVISCNFFYCMSNVQISKVTDIDKERFHFHSCLLIKHVNLLWKQKSVTTTISTATTAT